MKKKGFTLIELLVVIAIIGLLSTLAVVSLGSARQKARDTKRIAEVKALQTAIEMYKSDPNNADLPAGISGSASWSNVGTALTQYLPTMPAPADTYLYTICTTTNKGEYYVATALEGAPQQTSFTGTVSGGSCINSKNGTANPTCSGNNYCVFGK